MVARGRPTSRLEYPTIFFELEYYSLIGLVEQDKENRYSLSKAGT
jgi:hypothetical protein